MSCISLCELITPATLRRVQAARENGQMDELCARLFPATFVWQWPPLVLSCVSELLLHVWAGLQQLTDPAFFPALFKPKLHGAAYGKGIYLSPISSISFGYSGRNGWSHRAIQNPFGYHFFHSSRRPCFFDHLVNWVGAAFVAKWPRSSSIARSTCWRFPLCWPIDLLCTVWGSVVCVCVSVIPWNIIVCCLSPSLNRVSTLWKAKFTGQMRVQRENWNTDGRN